MDTDTINIQLRPIDNVLDLANFFKHFFQAEEVKIFSEGRESKDYIILRSYIKTENIFARHMGNGIMVVFVFMNKKVQVFFHNNPFIHMFDVLPSDFEKTGMEFMMYSFNTIQDFINFIKPNINVLIEFPKIDVKDFKERINLERRREALNEWREIFEGFIQYGVLVENQLDEYLSRKDWLFKVHLPARPVPKEIALENNLNDKYHNNYDDEHVILFSPGEDWNKKIQNIFSYLEKLYAIEGLKK